MMEQVILNISVPQTDRLGMKRAGVPIQAEQFLGALQTSRETPVGGQEDISLGAIINAMLSELAKEANA